MKTMVFALLAFAGLTLVGWQHQQLSQVRAENSRLQQSVAEANQLKADLAKFDPAQAPDADADFTRLQRENRDLLKLRNEVNQLRERRAEFQRVSAENLRLQSQVRNTPLPQSSEILLQPIVINLNGLYDHGVSTPEATAQTFFWAQHEGNAEALAHSTIRKAGRFRTMV